MHLVMPHCSRNDLHGILRLSPVGNGDFISSAISRRKKSRVPPKKPFIGKRLFGMLSCVNHNLNNTFHIMIYTRQSGIG